MTKSTTNLSQPTTKAPRSSRKTVDKLVVTGAQTAAEVLQAIEDLRTQHQLEFDKSLEELYADFVEWWESRITAVRLLEVMSGRETPPFFLNNKSTTRVIVKPQIDQAAAQILALYTRASNENQPLPTVGDTGITTLVEWVVFSEYLTMSGVNVEQLIANCSISDICKYIGLEIVRAADFYTVGYCQE